MCIRDRHPGTARLLANRLRGDPARCDEVIAFTGEHTRHWSAEDRLEQDLRLHALLADRDKLRQGLRDMLKRIHDEADEERRIRLARWTRPVSYTHLDVYKRQPNDLLEPLDRRSFSLPSGATVSAAKDQKLLTVITTNRERELQPSFLSLIHI